MNFITMFFFVHLSGDNDFFVKLDRVLNNSTPRKIYRYWTNCTKWNNHDEIRINVNNFLSNHSTAVVFMVAETPY